MTPPTTPDCKLDAPGVIGCTALLGVSREYALEQHGKYRQQLEDCDRSTLEALAMLLIQKRSVDGLNGRHWNAGAHRYFEDAVESMMRSMTPHYPSSAPPENDL
jgi:hypothetical protein